MGQVLAEAEGYHTLLEEQTQALLQQLSRSPASDRIKTEIKVIAGTGWQACCQWSGCGVTSCVLSAAVPVGARGEVHFCHQGQSGVSPLADGGGWGAHG